MSTQEWTDAITKALREPFPEEVVKSYNAGRSGRLRYIDARDVENRLDETVGPQGWSDAYEVIDPERMGILCRLTILGVTKCGVGYPNNAVGATNGKGDRIDSDEPGKEAESDALKRAAVKFGIGRHLYSDAPPRSGGGGQANERPTSRPAQRQEPSPRQSQPSTAATANQLATISKLSRMLGEPEAVPDELTTAGASDRIEELSRLYNERQAGAPKQEYADSKRTGPLPATAAAQAHVIREDLETKKKAPPTLAQLMEACAAAATARGAGQEAVQVLQEAVAAKQIAAATPGKLTELERTILLEWVRKASAEPKPLRI